MYLYYYHLLSSNEKMIYWRIERAIAEYKKEILIRHPDVPVERIKEISRLVTIDHPEYYWSKGDFICWINDGKVHIRFSYIVSQKDISEIDAAIFHIINKFCSFSDDANDKVKTVNHICEQILNNVNYDMSEDNGRKKINQTIYSAFIVRKSVCMGIAKTFDLIMRLIGIDSFIILGHVFGDKNVGHAWNVVKLGDQYLNVDITMSYPVFMDRWKNYIVKSDSCILVPFECISQSHDINQRFDYPIGDDCKKK